MDLATDGPVGGWVVPESAYIHIPFCRHRCGYCNFSVVADRDDLMDRFLVAIDSEIANLNRPSLRTLFLGGGTPTHLPLQKLDQLLACLHQRFDLTKLDEFSVEANPEDIEEEKLELLSQWGVNRISLGIQSFQPVKLKTLERNHSPQKAIAAVEQAANFFPNVSIDLIFGTPNESIAQWHKDLDTALKLPIQHLSSYALTYEKGTQFWSRRHQGQMQQVDESIEVEMYQTTRKKFINQGFKHYEVSNYSRTNAQCQHNMAYWRGEGWYAAGPGAARFVGGFREVNHRSTSSYLRRIENGLSPTAERESIDLHQYTRERAAFGIRLIDGFNLDLLSQHVGLDTATMLGDAIDQSIKDDLLVLESSNIRLTERGILFADTVAQRFLD